MARVSGKIQSFFFSVGVYVEMNHGIFQLYGWEKIE